MTDFTITVRDRAVTVDRRPTVVVSGSVNIYTMSVALDDAWDGYTCRAVFRCGLELREALIVDGACTVPWEALVPNGSLYIGVYGINGDKRMPTCWTPERIYVTPGTVTADASQDPSPTVFEELVAQTAENRAAAEAAMNTAEAAKQGTAADRLAVAGDKSAVAADREAVELTAQQVKSDATRAGNAANAAVGAATEATKSESAANDAAAQAGNDAAQTAQDREAAEASKLAAETEKIAAQAAQKAAETAAQAAAAHDIVLQTELTAIQQLTARSNIDAQKQAWESIAGYIATCTDANAGTCYPMTYGKSVQDGTPTPEAPVAVQGALTEAWGLRRYGENLADDAKLTVNGATWDSAEQAWYYNTHKDTQAVIFENTFGYAGQMLLSFYAKYIKSGGSSVGMTFRIYYSDGTDEFASPTTYVQGSGYKYFSIVSNKSKTVKSVKTSYKEAQTESWIKNIMLELGATATPYEPYTAQTIQFTAPSDGLPGIKLGATVPTSLQGRKGLWFDGTDWWIGNWMDADSGKMGVNIAKTAFNGTEIWVKNTTENDGKFLFYQIKFAINNNGVYPQSPYCSHTPTSLTHPSDVAGIYIASSGSLFLNVGDIIGGGTVAQLKAWIAAQYAAGNPVTVYYVSATETIADIPSDTLSALRSLTTLDGTNNIMVDGSTVQPWVSVKYRQDLQKYVKDKLAAIQAAIISLGGNI